MRVVRVVANGWAMAVTTDNGNEYRFVGDNCPRVVVGEELPVGCNPYKVITSLGQVIELG
ncbi:hypothetical protein ACI3E1_06200 [Ligilactobacillus sp. LYQ139]|uniref:hypothetical protein n=1 Tax=Ligilactobacillus sp. LYQ139 TaxID=3378800 RepID=UPI0038555C83